MSIKEHLNLLKQKHQEIEEKIDSLQAKPYFDQEMIAELKKKKLALKEEITSIETKA